MEPINKYNPYTEMIWYGEANEAMLNWRPMELNRYPVEMYVRKYVR